MAERRMFAKTIVLSDAFLDMPMSSRCLYFTLGMLADDDGFINNPRSIMRQAGCSEDDLKLLLAKRFLLAFESGVIVIKHWRINNYLRSDRYSETKYLEEKGQLQIEDNGAYREPEGCRGIPIGIPSPCTEVVGIPSGIPNNGIHSIGKDSIGKDIVDNNMCSTKGANSADAPSEDRHNSIDDVVNKHIRMLRAEEYPDHFNEFWSAYPRKKDKGMAYKAYMARIRSGYKPEDLIAAAKAYAAECRRNHTATDYIKHPKTFVGPSEPFVEYIPKHTDTEPPEKNGNPYAEYELEILGEGV